MANPKCKTIGDQIWWTYACLCGADKALRESLEEYPYKTRMHQWKKKDMRDFEDEAVEKMKQNTCCYCGKEEVTGDHLITQKQGW